VKYCTVRNRPKSRKFPEGEKDLEKTSKSGIFLANSEDLTSLA
jgi:hypothetical protein